MATVSVKFLQYQGDWLKGSLVLLPHQPQKLHDPLGPRATSVYAA